MDESPDNYTPDPYLFTLTNDVADGEIQLETFTPQNFIPTSTGTLVTVTLQISEGVECFSQAYTPTNTSNCDIWVTAHFHLAETSNIANGFGAGLFISSQTDALQVRSNYQDGSDSYHNGDITIIHKIATWSGARTFSLRASGTNSINYQHHGSGWAGTLYGANQSKSPFIIEEVAT